MMIGNRFGRLRLIVPLLFTLLSSFATAQSDEDSAGREIVSIYLGAAGLADDPALNRYVNLVGNRVASVSSRADITWTFGVLNTESVNAFAAPGGYILLTRGLLDLLETEDELAAVLAHEVSHVVRQHHWKIIKKQQATAAVIQRMQGNMTSSNALFSDINGLFSDMMTRGLDKSAEFEADRDAAVLAANAGYDCTAILSLLEKMGSLKADSDEASLLFQTHPDPEERLDQVVSAMTDDMDSCANLSAASTRYSRFVSGN
jgi:predicted Zn-dependent protease